MNTYYSSMVIKCQSSGRFFHKIIRLSAQYICIITMDGRGDNKQVSRMLLKFSHVPISKT